MNYLITGVAGLVGSRMTEELLNQGHSVVGVDNFTLGTRRHLAPFLDSTGRTGTFEFFEKDVSVPGWWNDLRGATSQFDALIHLAANSDISLGVKDPTLDFNLTLKTTFESLQAAKDLRIPDFLFASSSAVYGETTVFPTPEESTKMYPVSNYGACKLASENLISTFSNCYGLNAFVFRFGNVVGEKLTHGVIYDFIHRLRKNPRSLDVLGNGHQRKTYIHVDDIVTGMLTLYQRKTPENDGGKITEKTHSERFNVWNLSSDGDFSVREIAELCAAQAGTQPVEIRYGESSRGWVGDVARTGLDVRRMTESGFQPKRSSKQAVTDSVRDFYRWSSSTV